MSIWIIIPLCFFIMYNYFRPFTKQSAVSFDLLHNIALHNRLPWYLGHMHIYLQCPVMAVLQTLYLRTRYTKWSCVCTIPIPYCNAGTAVSCIYTYTVQILMEPTKYTDKTILIYILRVRIQWWFLYCYSSNRPHPHLHCFPLWTYNI